LINVDFAHVRRLIQSGGGALMAIGHGQGEEKAYQAIEQALHHPLLESVSLDNAAGIIVNFTGGDDLSLFEVQDALNKLQTQTGQQTEIVMGVINNPEMKDRVQAILVITGLGAPTLEETVSQFSGMAMHPETIPEPVPDLQAPIENYIQQEEPAHKSTQNMPYKSTSNNLDIPAFLRRRSGDIGLFDG